ncbi:hypothetical protein HYY74_05710 [Candidatus Woesearchaeota archaeon]|nr:hypothetical protein [Candidatus Woesearchaeota archaeon]
MYQPINSAYQTIRGAGRAAATLAVVGTLAALVAACGGSSGPEPRKVQTIECRLDETKPVAVIRETIKLPFDTGYAARVPEKDVVGTELSFSDCRRGEQTLEPQKILVMGSDQKLYGIFEMKPPERYRLTVNAEGAEHARQLDRAAVHVDKSKESKR